MKKAKAAHSAKSGKTRPKTKPVEKLVEKPIEEQIVEKPTKIVQDGIYKYSSPAKFPVQPAYLLTGAARIFTTYLLCVPR